MTAILTIELVTVTVLVAGTAWYAMQRYDWSLAMGVANTLSTVLVWLLLALAFQDQGALKAHLVPGALVVLSILSTLVMTDHFHKRLRGVQVRLLQSEKLASIGQLVAGVAHDLNTPLGAVVCNNDVLIRGLRRLRDGAENSPGLLEQLAEAQGVTRMACDRMKTIVDDLRTFARLDQAKRDRVNIEERCIETTIRLLSFRLKNRIDVQRNYAPLPPFLCYPDRLNQVFMNLLVNAIDAIAGTGTIRIVTRVHEDDALVEISDSGCGIDPSKIAKIFDPGHTTKGVGVGTGLGLAICNQIVSDHGGRIDVRSEVGKGTWFCIKLPLRGDSRVEEMKSAAV